MTDIKPIETNYNGYRFRSRLEARWAVFFDVLGIEWEYEKEGYDLDGIKYLPDFWLPKYQYWFEIKGQDPTTEEINKAKALQDTSGFPVIIAISLPHFNRNFAYCCDFSDSSAGYSEWENARWFICNLCKQIDLGISHKEDTYISTTNFEKVGVCQHSIKQRRGSHAQLMKAYNAAKAAQFEFGKEGN